MGHIPKFVEVFFIYSSIAVRVFEKLYAALNLSLYSKKKVLFKDEKRGRMSTYKEWFLLMLMVFF